MTYGSSCVPGHPGHLYISSCEEVLQDVLHCLGHLEIGTDSCTLQCAGLFPVSHLQLSLLAV